MDSKFEKKLAEQSMRELPGEWRNQILQAAAAREILAPQEKWTLADLFRSLVWPNGKAWGALAAVWVGILVLQFSSAEEAVSTSALARSDHSGWIQVLREQQQILTQLTQPAERAEAPRLRPTPTPRSHWRKEEEYQFA